MKTTVNNRQCSGISEEEEEEEEEPETEQSATEHTYYVNKRTNERVKQWQKEKATRFLFL